MSDEKPVEAPKPAEKAKPVGDPPPAKPAGPAATEAPGSNGGADAKQNKADEKVDGKAREAAWSREQALNRLREDATELSNGRFGKIVAEELDRLENVTNL